jgi:hypothetical protein
MVYPRPSFDAAIRPDFPSFSAKFPEFSSMAGLSVRRMPPKRELTPLHSIWQYSGAATLTAKAGNARSRSNV